jgi:hypothetical protein
VDRREGSPATSQTADPPQFVIKLLSARRQL